MACPHFKLQLMSSTWHRCAWHFTRKHFDLPKFAEDYVHRIGRTGRAVRQVLPFLLLRMRRAIC